MATTKIIIKGGKFTKGGSVLPYHKTISETHYEGNGWVCDIKKDKIICHSEREYSSGTAICHKEIKLQDGLLGLSGGNVTERYVYFRTKEFQNFLSEHGITAVKHTDPNGVYEEDFHRSGWGTRKIKIYTNGKKEEERIGGDFDAQTDVGNACHSDQYETKVTNATWVLVDSHIDYRDSHSSSRILYTLENPMKLDLTKVD